MSRRTSPLPKIKDVAHRASVSTGTVSRVLNEHRTGRTARTGTACDPGISYRPDTRAQNFVRESSRSIGMIPGNGAGFNSVHASLPLGIEEACSEAGYYLLFARHQYEAHVKPGDLQLPGLIQARAWRIV